MGKVKGEPLFKWVAFLAFFVSVGFFSSLVFDNTRNQLNASEHLVYSKSVIDLEQNTVASYHSLKWENLLPIEEKDILIQYQSAKTEAMDLTDQILNSIEAAADESFQSAMSSMNSVDNYNGLAIAIPGFIVPIEYHEDKSPSLIFIVPYYGACIHFPPPPPNQIIFARLEKGFNKLALEQAYLFKGIFGQGTFEDPLGSSAYQIEVNSIEQFTGEPDDFRRH